MLERFRLIYWKSFKKLTQHSCCSWKFEHVIEITLHVTYKLLFGIFRYNNFLHKLFSSHCAVNILIVLLLCKGINMICTDGAMKHKKGMQKRQVPSKICTCDYKDPYIIVLPHKCQILRLLNKTLPQSIMPTGSQHVVGPRNVLFNSPELYGVRRTLASSHFSGLPIGLQRPIVHIFT